MLQEISEAVMTVKSYGNNQHITLLKCTASYPAPIEDANLATIKDMKEAFIEYSDEALAHLLANKRVEDYKEASYNREVADTNALGSTVWILECDKVNIEKLKGYTSMNKQLATYYLTVLADEVSVAV